jgi:hypothetical protein
MDLRMIKSEPTCDRIPETIDDDDLDTISSVFNTLRSILILSSCLCPNLISGQFHAAESFRSQQSTNYSRNSQLMEFEKSLLCSQRHSS